jgi:hypothetical protein
MLTAVASACLSVFAMAVSWLDADPDVGIAQKAVSDPLQIMSLVKKHFAFGPFSLHLEIPLKSRSRNMRQ